MLNERFAEMPTPWPGDRQSSPDRISIPLVDAFYNEHLPASARRVFRGITGHPLDPSTAVIRCPVPQVVKDVLHQLRPDALVELHPSIRSSSLDIQSTHRVSPQYIRDVITSAREQFLAAYGEDSSTVREVVRGVNQYMLADNSQLAVPSASLHRLPLLPLADGTLGNIEAEGEQIDQIYADSDSWARNRP